MTQVAIKYVNDAKPGKKYGSIKDSSGNTYWVPAGMVAQFQPNTTVDVNLSQQTWGQNQVQVVAGFANGDINAKASMDSGVMQRHPAPPSQTVNGHVNEAEKSGYIFVTGCLQQALGAGKIEAKDIPTVAQMLVDTWTNYIRGKV
jgi:hypothetical protein